MAAAQWTLCRLAGLALSTALLAACASLQLSEPYDARIEDGVNTYHKSFIVFTKGLQFAGHGEDGRYDAPASRAFYATAAAELGNTILRAKANNPDGTCPSAEAAALGLGGLIDAVAPGGLPQGLADDDATAEVVTLADGSCTVVTLLVLKYLHDSFERIHRKQTFVSPNFVLAQGQNIDSAAETAITAEQSKRP